MNEYRMRFGRRKRKKKKWPRVLAVVLAIVLGLGVGMAGALWVHSRPVVESGSSFAPGQAASVVPSGENAPGAAPELPVSDTANPYTAQPLPEEMRAMWCMFLEWSEVDWSTEQTARQGLADIFQNCADMGLNTVICHVRPFGDALYPSAYYPWSHVLTGTQGQNPGYDPLALMVEEAHVRGLRFEALINPYRVQYLSQGPQQYAANSPAVLHPEWVREVEGTAVLDPGIPEVRRLIANGVQEIVENYDVDGIQFDDYFYLSGTSDDFDAETFAQYGAGLALDAWRRENVNDTVRQAFVAVKAGNPTASFGISPAGNNDNNYHYYYADVKYWMANEGYIDYVMPQLYWGFTRTERNGSTAFAFDNIAATWASYPRAASVKLYAGLGAYRIGMLEEDGTRSEFGHGGVAAQDEWESGHNLTDQVEYLRTLPGVSGFGLYRYDFLFQKREDPVSKSEVANLTALLQQ